jgi:hypothetical protein
MKFRSLAWTMGCINTLAGSLGLSAGVAIIQGASHGLQHPQSGPNQFGMGMFVGSFGLVIVVISSVMLGLAAGSLLIAWRSQDRLPGWPTKAFLTAATLAPFLVALLLAALGIFTRSILP